MEAVEGDLLKDVGVEDEGSLIGFGSVVVFLAGEVGSSEVAPVLGGFGLEFDGPAVEALGVAHALVVVLDGAEIVIGRSVFAIEFDGAVVVGPGVRVHVQALVGHADFVVDLGGLGELFVGLDGFVIVLTGGEQIGKELWGHDLGLGGGRGGGGGLLMVGGDDTEQSLGSRAGGSEGAEDEE